MARTTKGGTGTPPHGEVPDQGPPTVQEQLDQISAKLERFEQLLGERGNEFAQFLVQLGDRHNWVETILHALNDDKLWSRHEVFADFPRYNLHQGAVRLEENPLSPPVVIPDEWRPEPEETDEESEEASE